MMMMVAAHMGCISNSRFVCVEKEHFSEFLNTFKDGTLEKATYNKKLPSVKQHRAY